MAGTRVTITHAGKSDEPQHVKMTAGATPKPENNPEILPGDTIYVERTGIVYVIGDVARPGGFPMDHDEQLINSAGSRAGSRHQPHCRERLGQAHPHHDARPPGDSDQSEKDAHLQRHRLGSAGQRYSFCAQQRRQECIERHGGRRSCRRRCDHLSHTLTPNAVVFHIETFYVYLCAITVNTIDSTWYYASAYCEWRVCQCILCQLHHLTERPPRTERKIVRCRLV